MVIAVILLLGTILRLVNLNQSLWLDEAVQAITSQGSWTEILAELRGDFHPPLYHVLMWLWVQAFGSSEVVLRLPSVFFGVATIGVVYLIGRLFTSEVKDKDSSEVFLSKSGLRTRISTPGVESADTPGVIAALFMATAPFHIYYSQEARLYSLACFLASLSMYFFICLIKTHPGCPDISPRGWKAGYILATAFLLYTDYYGFLILLAQAVFLLWQKKYLLLRYCLIPVLLFLPWLPMFLIQLKTGRQVMISLPEWGRLVNLSFLKALPLTFIKFSIGRITIFNKKLYVLAAGLLFFLYSGIILRVIRQRILVIRKKIKLETGCLILDAVFLWLLLPLFLAWLASLFIPNYQPFRLLLVLPAFYLLLAFGVAGIRQTKILMNRFIKILLVLVVNLVCWGVYYFNPYFHREDWRGAVNFVNQQITSQEKIILIPSHTSYWPYIYYTKGMPRLFWVGSGVRPINDQDLEFLKQLLEKTETVYYFPYLETVFDPRKQIRICLKEADFGKIKEINFNQILVWEYRRYQ